MDQLQNDEERDKAEKIANQQADIGNISKQDLLVMRAEQDDRSFMKKATKGSKTKSIQTILLIPKTNSDLGFSLAFICCWSNISVIGSLILYLSKSSS